MNLEFLIAIGFGLGIAGLLKKYLTEQATALSQRVGGVLRLQSHSSISFREKLKTIVNSQGSRGNSMRLNRALMELPELMGLIEVSLRAGEGIYRSFSTVVPRCEGELARELERALKSVQYGAAFVDELRIVSQALPQPQVSEFLAKVVLSLERGTPLAKLLQEQSLSVRSEIKNQLLRQAGKNETRMLVPLVFMILPVTVLFAIYPSLELLNFGFI